MKDLQLLWVYNSRLQPGTSVKNLRHDCFHLLNILDGKMRFVLAEEEYVLEKGDMVFVPKGTQYRFANEFPEAVSYYQIKFTVLSKPLCQLLEDTQNRVIRDGFACQLVDRISREYLEGRLMKDEAAEAALKTLVLHLTAGERSVRGEAPEVIDTTGCNPLSKRVIDYLTQHYMEEVSLDDVSNAVGITKNYLCNAFKQDTGTTINGCLNTIRVRKAAELIVYGDLPLAQVAQLCGYVSVSHFNRVFMRYVGIPPGQCRRAFSFENLSNAKRSAGSFMFSVLAGKSITPEQINEFEQRKKEEKD